MKFKARMHLWILIDDDCSADDEWIDTLIKYFLSILKSDVTFIYQ